MPAVAFTAFATAEDRQKILSGRLPGFLATPVLPQRTVQHHCESRQTQESEVRNGESLAPE
jgi:hypothetical protein